ncbi:hypothetical protein F4678DRAFT_45145 [Xylaria arbuscula]|nr:hypothetical protein F4678DRAFT_45145 [Xylaria arbuscula]
MPAQNLVFVCWINIVSPTTTTLIGSTVVDFGYRGLHLVLHSFAWSGALWGFSFGIGGRKPGGRVRSFFLDRKPEKISSNLKPSQIRPRIRRIAYSFVVRNICELGPNVIGRPIQYLGWITVAAPWRKKIYLKVDSLVGPSPLLQSSRVSRLCTLHYLKDIDKDNRPL